MFLLVQIEFKKVQNRIPVFVFIELFSFITPLIRQMAQIEVLKSFPFGGLLIFKLFSFDWRQSIF